MMALIPEFPVSALRCTARRLARIMISAGSVLKIHRLKLTEDSLIKTPSTGLTKIRSSPSKLGLDAFQSEQISIWTNGVIDVE
jgi:hypothetical protein